MVIDYRYNLSIQDLEKRLKQGKLSFASVQRLQKYLGVMPGSVSPFALITDAENHVHVFFDENLQHATKISFHPNITTVSIVLNFSDFMKFMHYTNNTFEFIKLYE